MLMLLVVSLMSWGQLQNKTPTQIPCMDQVFHALAQMESPQAWEPIKEGSTTQLRASTKKKDITLELKYSSDFSELLRVSPRQSVRYRYEAPKCATQFRVVDLKFSTIRKDIFTDENLSKVLEQSERQKTKGFFYIWSPQMNLSVRGLKEATELAKNLHLQIIPLLDPNIEMAGARNVVKLQSRELLSHEVLTHYPTVLLFSEGKLLPSVRHGYDEPQRFRKFLTTELL